MKSNMAVLRILSNMRSSFHVTDFIGNIFERASNPPICIVMVLIPQEGPKSPLAPPLFCPIEDQNWKSLALSQNFIDLRAFLKKIKFRKRNLLPQKVFSFNHHILKRRFWLQFLPMCTWEAITSLRLYAPILYRTLFNFVPFHWKIFNIRRCKSQTLIAKMTLCNL